MYIKREDAIEAVCGVVIDEFDTSPTVGYEVAEKALSALPSADAVHIETYRELYEKYVELKHASAEAVQEDNEIIKAINTIENFLEQGVFISTSMWRAKDGTVLKTDWGYFEDGLKEILDYVEHKGGGTE